MLAPSPEAALRIHYLTMLPEQALVRQAMVGIVELIHEALRRLFWPAGEGHRRGRYCRLCGAWVEYPLLHI